MRTEPWVRRRAAASFPVLVLLLPACIPMVRHDYHRPEAAGGELVTSTCPGTPSFLLLEAHGAVVGIRTLTTGLVHLTFSLPEEGPYHLLHPHLTFFDGDGRPERVLLAGPALEGSDGPPHLLRRVSFVRRTRLHAGPGADVTLRAHLSRRPAGAFGIKLPDLQTPNGPWEGPLVRFKPARHRFWLAPLNC